jgi:hypothetical protein
MYSRENGVEILKAKTKAYRFPKGQSGNPDGQSRFYHECRKLANRAAPDMMRGLIELANNAEDERVRSVCLMAVLDRAGVRPIDKPEPEPERDRSWDPRKYTLDELMFIRRALVLMAEDRRERPAEVSEPEVLGPSDEDGSG